jgi:type 1 glutamine amidotransferase
VLVIGPEKHKETQLICEALNSCLKFTVTRAWLPNELPEGVKYDAVVLASIMNEWFEISPRTEWEKIFTLFVERGGGLIGIHDAVNPYSNHKEYTATFEGNRASNIVHHPTVTARLLGIEPRMQFVMDWRNIENTYLQPIFYTAAQEVRVEIADPYAEPNLWLSDFSIDEEILPFNITPEVEPFLVAAVRDTNPNPPAFYNQEFVVSGGRFFSKGRTAFCSLGHNEMTYQSASFRLHLTNLVYWCAAKSIGQSIYDISKSI